jgi:hypothetical protein
MSALLVSSQSSFFSLESGATYSNWRDASFLNYDYSPGLEIGLSYGKGFGDDDRWEINPGVFYQQKGIKYDGKYTDIQGENWGDFQQKQIHHVIQMPVALNYFLTSNRKIFITAGVYVGYFISGTIRTRTIETETKEKNIYKSKMNSSEWKGFESGLGAGVGYVFKIKKEPVLFTKFCYQYSVGLFSERSYSSQPFYLIQLSVGYRLLL